MTLFAGFKEAENEQPRPRKCWEGWAQDGMSHGRKLLEGLISKGFGLFLFVYGSHLIRKRLRRLALIVVGEILGPVLILYLSALDARACCSPASAAVVEIPGY